MPANQLKPVLVLEPSVSFSAPGMEQRVEESQFSEADKLLNEAERGDKVDQIPKLTIVNDYRGGLGLRVNENPVSKFSFARLRPVNSHIHSTMDRLKQSLFKDRESCRRYQTFFICFIGIMVSFVTYGIVLETVTGGGKEKTGPICSELALIAISSSIYFVVATGFAKLTKEETGTIPKRKMVLLSLLTFVSTWTSIFALRYISFPSRVLGKSCKAIPVMLIGKIVNRRKYTWKKYLAVTLICLGVGLFMLGGHTSSNNNQHAPQGKSEIPSPNESAQAPVGNDSKVLPPQSYPQSILPGEDRGAVPDNRVPAEDTSPQQNSAPSQSASRSSSFISSLTAPVKSAFSSVDPGLLGVFLLAISLIADGLTGALEDQYLSQYTLGPMQLMAEVHQYRSVLSWVLLFFTGEAFEIPNIFSDHAPALVLLGLSGAAGQLFIFVTISSFGALVSSLACTCRKLVTVTASVLLFGHQMASLQILGLAVTFGGILLNMMARGKKGAKRENEAGRGNQGQTRIRGQAEYQKVELGELQTSLQDDLEPEEESSWDIGGQRKAKESPPVLDGPSDGESNVALNISPMADFELERRVNGKAGSKSTVASVFMIEEDELAEQETAEVHKQHSTIFSLPHQDVEQPV